MVKSAERNLFKKRWHMAINNLIFFLSCGVATVFTFGFLMFASIFVPSEEGYADNLTIPEVISSWGVNAANGSVSMGNELHESRIMIESGGVWVEIFEQSDNPERRVTRATVTSLENLVQFT